MSQSADDRRRDLGAGAEGRHDDVAADLQRRAHGAARIDAAMRGALQPPRLEPVVGKHQSARAPASPRRSRRSLICAKSLRCSTSRAETVSRASISISGCLSSARGSAAERLARARLAGLQLLLLAGLRRRDRRQHGDHLFDQPALPPEQLERRVEDGRGARASSRRRSGASNRNRRASRCRPSPPRGSRRSPRPGRPAARLCAARGRNRRCCRRCGRRLRACDLFASSGQSGSGACDASPRGRSVAAEQPDAARLRAIGRVGSHGRRRSPSPAALRGHPLPLGEGCLSRGASSSLRRRELRAHLVEHRLGLAPLDAGDVVLVFRAARRAYRRPSPGRARPGRARSARRPSRSSRRRPGRLKRSSRRSFCTKPTTSAARRWRMPGTRVVTISSSRAASG